MLWGIGLRFNLRNGTLGGMSGNAALRIGLAGFQAREALGALHHTAAVQRSAIAGPIRSKRLSGLVEPSPLRDHGELL